MKIQTLGVIYQGNLEYNTYSQLAVVLSLLMRVCSEHHEYWLLPKLLTELVAEFFFFAGNLLFNL